jgi:DNA-binding SARP family transcriptional activator
MDLSARLDIADLLNAALRVRIAVALARRDRAGARRLIDEARTLAVTPVDSALLDYLEGVYALRVRAFARAVDRLSQSAKALEAVHRLHHAARAYLLLGEAALGNGVQRRAETALNRMAELTGMLDCEGYLRAPARMARQVFAERHLLRGLQKRARVLLDRLAGAVPALTVLQPADQDTDAAQPHRTLHVSPFGQGAVVLANRAVEPHALPPKARELLFYAVRMARPLLRAELLETLWGDEHGAAPNLWDASRHLRRLLGEHSWVNSGGRYALHLDIQDDGHEFDQMASAALGKGSTYERLAAAERALELLGSGGYLEWCDSLWATSERTRVMTRAMAVALVLVRLYDEMGRCQEAIAICRRALGFDPYDEAPRLALLRLLVADGQVETAIQEYNVYRQLLHEELAAEPSMAVCTVVAKLKRCR